MPLKFVDLHPLTRNLPPVAMLCSSDLPGAGGAAMELNTALSAAGADVALYVMQKTSTRAGIVEIAQGTKSLSAYSFIAEKLLSKFRERPPYFEMFSLVQKPVGVHLSDLLDKAAIIHLHWVARMVGFPKSMEALQNKPIVWTLHDMNPLSGGCHYTAGCGRFANGGCRACPQLGEASGPDIAKENFTAKQKGYAALNLTAVSPSSWQLDYIKNSVLLGDIPQEWIPNSVDPDVFHPRQRAWARASLGLAQDRKIIAFGAASIDRWNKGAQLLKLALKELRCHWQGALPVLLIFGHGDMKNQLPDGYEHVSMGRTGQAELAVAYSAADIFVSASMQETFGLVTAEAQACGTPAIGFYGTGAEEIIEEGKTGFLAVHPGLPLTEDGTLRRLDEFLSPATVGDLAQKIETLLSLPDEQIAAMRKRCRENALRRFSPVLNAARYLRLYRRILRLPEVYIEGLSE
jgi:glycosyltransferase involved in cell wall biosynthesis